MISGSPDVKTWPATPLVFSSRISRLILRDPGVQLVGRGIVQEQRAALRGKLGSGHVEERVQHIVEVVVGRHPARDLQQQLEELQPPDPGTAARALRLFARHREGPDGGRLVDVHGV
jgi:hypothetical protein